MGLDGWVDSGQRRVDLRGERERRVVDGGGLPWSFVRWFRWEVFVD